MRNGIDRDAAQASRQRRETADSQIEGHKNRITAGLLASAQTFTLGPNILAVTLERKRISDIVISTKETKQKATRIQYTSRKSTYIEGTEQNKRTDVCARIEINGALVQMIR